jgi:Tfp pilus assembly protein PilX
MTRTTRRHRRGIFLVNILMAIGLMAAFVIVAERVFRLSLLTSARAAASQDTAVRLERATDVLRADVWTATSVQANAAGTMVTLKDPAGHPIEWRTDAKTGDLVRLAGEQERRWPALALSFRADNGLLSVSNKSTEVAVMRRAGGSR